MLKIKDDVDLKKLKKFGFEQVKDNKNKLMARWYTGTASGAFILICDDDKNSRFNREVFCHNWNIYDFLDTNLDTLYDLIQSGLVEKVKE